MLSLVPLELFTQKGLSYIVSALGTPSNMDNITTLQQRLAYVKVCFEISVDFELPGFINVELHDGPLFLLELKYYGCRCIVYSANLLVILVSTILRRMR
ncbi:hypothetical protein Gohar_006960 [Gossypium harknessii]|uniref:Uncharacterized protein n=1 Tax=Gossypium harknessii TaxID=34285 RepID=A0A7J9GF28_9ROSI|nr:hypothetical protein [Gossypium harknessii]